MTGQPVPALREPTEREVKDRYVIPRSEVLSALNISPAGEWMWNISPNGEWLVFITVVRTGSKPPAGR